MNAVLAIWYKLDSKVRWPAIKQHYLRGGIFLFAIYFCMFSNIFASVIMAVYIGTAMGYDLAEDLIKKRYNTVSYCRKHVMEFIILLAWGTAQVFEINGKRSEWAENLSGGQKYLDFLRESFKEGIRVLLSMKKGFMLVMLVIVAIGIISIIKNKNHVAEKECVLWGVSAMMMTLYLVLSCAKVAPRYITRSDVFYGVFFFGMMVVLTCLEQIMNRFLIFRIAIPLILFVITVNCNTEGKTFQESTVNSIDSDICMAVSEDIIAQMMEAERAGMTEIVLYVPEFSTTDNWPLATYANNRFSEHLWKYNILKHKIRIICVQPSMEKNKELHLP